MTSIPKKIHALVIPKGKYIDLDDFINNANDKELVGLLKGINIVAKKLNITNDTGQGYRSLTNIGSDMEDKKFPIYIFTYLVEKKLVKWSSDFRSC